MEDGPGVGASEALTTGRGGRGLLRRGWSSSALFARGLEDDVGGDGSEADRGSGRGGEEGTLFLLLRAREYSGHLPLGGLLSTTESLRRRWGCEVKKERKALLGSSLYIIA
jgi:hypothetical protein